MRTTEQMRQLWAPHGPSHNTARFLFWNGVYVNGDRYMVEALTALDRILRKYNYAPKQDETWGYNNRAITGGSRPSLHAYGIAFDINSRSNPYGQRLITNMDRRMVEEIEAIRTTEGRRVWRWGGDWNDDNVQNDSSYDAMHFESQASPRELAAGIDFRNAPPAPTPAPQPPAAERSKEAEMAIIEARRRPSDVDGFPCWDVEAFKNGQLIGAGDRTALVHSVLKIKHRDVPGAPTKVDIYSPDVVEQDVEVGWPHLARFVTATGTTSVVQKSNHDLIVEVEQIVIG